MALLAGHNARLCEPVRGHDRRLCLGGEQEGEGSAVEEPLKRRSSMSMLLGEAEMIALG